MSRRPHSNHVWVTQTPTPPPPKTWSTPTYQLERYTIRRNVKTVNVQLHGLRDYEKRTESMSFPLLPNVADAELVRAAVILARTNGLSTLEEVKNHFMGLSFASDIDPNGWVVSPEKG